MDKEGAVEELHRRANAVGAITVMEGWQVICQEIREIKERTILELRRTSGDKSERKKGELDMIDIVLNLPDLIIGRRDSIKEGGEEE